MRVSYASSGTEGDASRLLLGYMRSLGRRLESEYPISNAKLENFLVRCEERRFAGLF
jgi:hypothetical protein